MRKQSELIKERMRQVMLADRVSGIETLLTVLKSDVTAVLSNYMALDFNAVEITADTDESDSGGYEFTIKVRTNRLIAPGRMIVG
ncbi:MAG: cell division topological specificity factor MinE [Firmicutes bacterium]|nr:cell division topological specificity factor MinE [Bacillota bacterium]